MYRFALDYLKDWKIRENRKPLIIRGARQVGKSFLVEMFAREEFQDILKIDFEKNPDIAQLFASKSPKNIVRLLDIKFEKNVSAGKTLLFLDEIQATPEVLQVLRYFYEECPELHIIAAGSLLEFAIENHKFSMPVGRIEYLHLGPMQFEEFLIALGKEKLRQYLCEYFITEKLPPPIHSELMGLLKQYTIIGGMPEVVSIFSKTNSYKNCEMAQQSILSTYKDDFNKYIGRTDPKKLEMFFNKIPSLVGKKFKYSHVNREEKSRDLQNTLHLLALSRVVSLVKHSSCNGIPLGAEVDDSKFKLLFLDVGLVCRSLRLNASEIESINDLMLVNNGSLCEQFIGQHLLYSKQFYEEPELNYWVREKSNSAAEVDYVISIGQTIISVEVKSGKSGTMKSLHMFLREKKRNFGLRFSGDLPSLLDTSTNIADGNNVPFRLLSLPLYMVGQSKRLCNKLLESK